LGIAITFGDLGAMKIWPAIDLRGGKCVRLQQGDYARETVFSDNPAAMAQHWVDQGADCLHLVDLDGAREGLPVNFNAVRAILKAIAVPCELGGGIRDEQSLARWFELGVSRLVVGTRALSEPDWFHEMCRRFPERLVLGIDARDGRVATHGWLETSDVAATELAAQYADDPIAAIVYTDIATDGMLTGPNLAALRELRQAVELPIVASGGVTCAADVAALAAIPVEGCIIGRALYEGVLTLPDALAAARGSPIPNP
jgi:phosphoribosylformimino-5-aminoimidazole carboxamide ribotide isomerase